MVILADVQKGHVFSLGRSCGVINGCVAAFLFALTLPVLSQGLPSIAPSASSPLKPPNLIATTKSSSGLKVSSKPEWQDLTPTQQLSLQPLAANWNSLEEAQKRKWIAIAANYPTLPPAEQVKLHTRMTEWVSLSYQQRAQARLNFAQAKQLTPTEKTATWQAYQALSPEEKKKLATLAPPKLGGAAIAAKPVTAQKLTTVPVTRQTAMQPLKSASSSHAVHQNTLLPQAKPATESASKPNN